MHRETAFFPALLERLAGIENADARLQAITHLLAPLEKSRLADLLEPFKFSEVQRLSLIRQFLPALNADRHPQLHKAACSWLTIESSGLSKPDAVALASCCDRQEIPAILTRIGMLEALPAAVEEFAWMLEYRHSYLKHFPAPNELEK